MSAKYWIKLYHEILDDPKMGRLPDRLWRRTIELFLLAGEMDQADGQLPPVPDMSWRLRVSDEELLADLQQLEKIGVLTPDRGGTWYVTKFAARQAAISDVDRKREQRERDRKQPAPVTAPVTVVSRSTNGNGHAPVTFRDTDTDTDSEPDSEPESNPLPPPRSKRARHRPRKEEEVNLFSIEIENALRAANVFPDLWPEVYASSLKADELLAMLAWSQDGPTETPGALFMSRIRSGAKLPAKYRAPPCPGCGRRGDHDPGCRSKYVNGDLSRHYVNQDQP